MRAKMAMAPKDTADKAMRNTPYKRSKYTDFKILTSEFDNFSANTIPFFLTILLGLKVKRSVTSHTESSLCLHKRTGDQN
jgi:hypothetical protein